MHAYEPAFLRNVVLTGHSRAGKTTLAEAMLLAAGHVTRAGRVEDGNTVSDYDEQEHLHGYSIAMTPIAVEWREHRVNLIDTPGFPDFEGELVCGAAAAEAGVVVVDAVSGVQGGTIGGWEHLEASGVACRLFAITHLDRENTDFARTVDALRERFGERVVALAVPDADGVVDLVAGARPEDAEARDQLIEAVADFSDDVMARYLEGDSVDADLLRGALADAVRGGAVYPVLPVSPLSGVGVAELLDCLLDLVDAPLTRRVVLEGGDELAVAADGPPVARVLKTVVDPFVGHLSVVKVLSGTLPAGAQLGNPRAGAEERAAHLFVLRGKEQVEVPALVAGDIGAIPKLSRAATGDLLLGDGVLARLPALPFPVPTYRSAVHPHSKEDVDKLSTALARLREQDPTIAVERDAETAELILVTVGEAQAKIAAARLHKPYGVAVDLDVPRVPFRETVVASTEKEYRHKKQTGGHGQFGHVVIKVEPLSPGGGFEFAEHVIGGAVPKQFIPAVEAGVHEALADGPLSGSRIVDLKVTLLGGSSHPVDSSEMSFKTAASHALKEAVREAQPGLLEPIMRLRLHIPADRLGDVVSDITGRRGSVQNVDAQGEATVVDAQAPLAEVQRYASELRAISGGRGWFEETFDHYAPVPAHVQERLLEARASRG
ncbi:MAG: elongation factor G [Dehalococcoidia bacterium]